METLVIKRDVNLKDIDELFLKILDLKNTPYKIRLPNSLVESGNLGVEAYLIQLISTWARISNRSILHTYVNDNEGFEKLCSKLYGITALSLADEILNSKKDVVKKAIALNPAVPIVENIRRHNFIEAYKGLYLGIMSIKAGGNSTELNMPYYHDGELVNKDIFKIITKKAIFSVLNDSQKKKITNEIIVQLSEIIRELFTNTHKHARQDENGNFLLKNIRCVVFSNSTITKKRLEDWLYGAGVKRSKFATNWQSYISQHNLPILDVSVIDSGPGFARRWTGSSSSQLTEEKEIEAVLNCFKKNYTSENKYSSGTGLINVLKSIKELNGMFRLSTGRIIVEKGYTASYKEKVNVNINDIVTRDFSAEGSAFNFLIPLANKV